jgi:tRNA(Ile)-lysidine synthase
VDGVTRLLSHNALMLQRVESFIHERDLIEPGGDVTCLVSGGADSTCLWHALGELGYRVSALHVAHGLRGAESDEDARFCREAFGAEVVEASGATEAALRDARYAVPVEGVRATGHTASDQVESVLLGLVASGSPQRIKARRDDGVVRPLLGVWREETRAYCDERRLPYREDSSNEGTKRGLIRNEILPLLEQLDPRARASLLSLADERPRLPRTLERTLADLLANRDGTKAADLGAGVRAVREYGTLRLEGSVEWGPWTIASERAGLDVRARRPGDRLAGRRKKVQDLLVDAKVPRAERDGWPLVVSGDEVVAVPGVAEAPGWEGEVTWRR